MFERFLKNKAGRRAERTQIEVADQSVAEKQAIQIENSLKSLLSDQKYAEALKVVLKPSVFGSADSRLAACAGYLIAKLKKPDEALQFVEYIKNNNLRATLYRATMLYIARQSYSTYVKKINVRGSTANLTQEVHKKLDEVVERIAKIQNQKDRDVAYEALVIAGRYELNYLGVHSKLLSIAEGIEDDVAHDKLVSWYVLSTSNLPEILNQGIANIRDSFERDLLLIDLGVKLSENISDHQSERSAMPAVMHLLDQSHQYDAKVIEYRDAALEEMLDRLLSHRNRITYVPSSVVHLLGKVYSDSIRNRVAKNILKAFKEMAQVEKKKTTERKRRYAYDRADKREMDEEYKKFIFGLQNVLRNIIGEGLITDKKLIGEIESEMLSGFFGGGALAA